MHHSKGISTQSEERGDPWNGRRLGPKRLDLEAFDHGDGRDGEGLGSRKDVDSNRVF